MKLILPITIAVFTLLAKGDVTAQGNPTPPCRARTLDLRANTILLIPTMRGVWFDYALLIGTLLRKQFRIAVFDAHGCGCNASLAGIKFEPFLKDICAITDTLRANFSGSLGAFGSSLGGIVSLCLLAAGVRFDSLVAEGCSVTRDGGLVLSFSDEPPSVQAYYLVFYRAAIEHIRAMFKSEPTRIALTWGERDNFIKAPERVEAINFIRDHIGEPVVREAANGTHYPQIGFPMNQHEIDDYLTFITDFFKGAD